jgi:hypothetical protein
VVARGREEIMGLGGLALVVRRLGAGVVVVVVVVFAVVDYIKLFSNKFNCQLKKSFKIIYL